MLRQTLRISLFILTFALFAWPASAIERSSKHHERRPPTYYPRSTSTEFTASRRQLGVFEVTGSLGSPTGLIDHLGDIQFRNAFRRMAFNSSDVYSHSFALGANIGVVRMGHWCNSVGFQYSRLRVKDTIRYPRSDSALTFNDTDFPKPNFNQYEVRLNSNWQFYDLEKVGWTPYVGMGLGVGIISQSLVGYESHTELNLGMAINFGAEVKIWQDPNGRNLATLASVNSWEFAGSGYRPKFLTLGVALKIYSRL
ncbi:MAG: hypothetical protein WAU88_09195 [Candidatus Zixiibacteriota bacterium]